MWTYKQPPVTKSVRDLSLMVLAATVLHHQWIAAAGVGRPWTAITFVPSTHHAVERRPLVELARQVQPCSVEQRFLLGLGASARDGSRDVLHDRFTVPDHYRSMLRGGHVLVLDGTWVSGSNAQSAALAVRAAGADQVTLLVIGRWCRTDWPPCQELLHACTEPYN